MLLHQVADNEAAFSFCGNQMDPLTAALILANTIARIHEKEVDKLMAAMTPEQLSILSTRVFDVIMRVLDVGDRLHGIQPAKPIPAVKP